MQRSLVSMSDGSNSLQLSGVLSEWLFSSKFWRDFNANNGTMFDQFEEDEMNVILAGRLLEALMGKLSELRKVNESDVSFVYRWTYEKKPVSIRISRESLIAEISEFCEFLSDAIRRNVCVSLSL